MKQVTNMSRLVNQLEKMFRMLNADMFGGELDTPIITVIPTARAYAHYSVSPIWKAGEASRHEINIAAATLDRPLENIAASLVHEMCHFYNDTVLHVQDTSRRSTYHNKAFKQTAEAHGLVCRKDERYGWAITEPGEALIDWLLLHDEFNEIEICRANPIPTAYGLGANAANGGAGTAPTGTVNHNYRYQCPKCGAIARSGKPIKLICGDCLAPMI